MKEFYKKEIKFEYLKLEIVKQGFNEIIKRLAEDLENVPNKDEVIQVINKYNEANNEIISSIERSINFDIKKLEELKEKENA